MLQFGLTGLLKEKFTPKNVNPVVTSSSRWCKVKYNISVLELHNKTELQHWSRRWFVLNINKQAKTKTKSLVCPPRTECVLTLLDGDGEIRDQWNIWRQDGCQRLFETMFQHFSAKKNIWSFVNKMLLRRNVSFSNPNMWLNITYMWNVSLVCRKHILSTFILVISLVKSEPVK